MGIKIKQKYGDVGIGMNDHFCAQNPIWLAFEALKTMKKCTILVHYSNGQMMGHFYVYRY